MGASGQTSPPPRVRRQACQAALRAVAGATGELLRAAGVDRARIAAAAVRSLVDE